MLMWCAECRRNAGKLVATKSGIPVAAGHGSKSEHAYTLKWVVHLPQNGIPLGLPTAISGQAALSVC